MRKTTPTNGTGRWRGNLLLAALLLLVQPVLAQHRFTRPAHLSEKARIAILTISPGAELYTAFGHTAIRITDPEYGLDELYNYGTFSFEQPGFYLKFCRGQLDYFLSAYPFTFGMSEYIEYRRNVIQQTLNLSPAMKQAVYAFLRNNYRPENRYYRYDFFFDNCATRIRDVFEQVLGDRLTWHFPSETPRTFRQHLDPYLKRYPWVHLGIDLGLGAKADRPATPRETMFLPDYVFRAFAGATVRFQEQERPLVARTDTLLWFGANPHGGAALPWPTILFWGLVILVGAGSWKEATSPNKSISRMRWADGGLFGVTGLIGVIIALLWFATEHKVTAPNYHLLWAWPTHLPAVVFLLRRGRPGWFRGYLMVYTAVAAVTLLGWPFWPQEFHPATLPLVLCLFIRA
ncbi:MAG: DUF4105 domain-containing protein, partial [Calditrichaeota bacterium]